MCVGSSIDIVQLQPAAAEEVLLLSPNGIPPDALGAMATHGYITIVLRRH